MSPLLEEEGGGWMLKKSKTKVIKLFDSLVEPLSNEDYRDLCENLAANFQTRYDAVCEEIEE